ncbi:IclR family transcriptional regulator [Microbacterium sp. SSW1-49]|uniref:IclR family transcriptional regulator n=1 Tax=Microbacterium croceum TaxID=2851645 RepID=A0ABT0FA86_9MICO|nr:IclR family transcriptional regulator [Microbacterium croceum]MCK2034938.1 IclR family transcriptional regulator [Microbacterium croceum]
MNENKTAVVKSADRALSVLEYLAREPSPRSLADIAAELGIPRSSVFGLLHNLTGRGWLTAYDGAVTTYRIGPQALTVGSAYIAGDDIVRRSEAVIDELSAALGETVHLGVLDGSEIVYLAKRDARHSLRLVSSVGFRLPAYATALGKMLLSDLSGAQRDWILSLPRRRITAKTLVDGDALLADLEETRARGYAIDDEESTEGVRCFAVPLGTHAPHTHAISCSVPVARLDDVFQDRVVQELRRAAAAYAQIESTFGSEG